MAIPKEIAIPIYTVPPYCMISKFQVNLSSNDIKVDEEIIYKTQINMFYADLSIFLTPCMLCSMSNNKA